MNITNTLRRNIGTIVAILGFILLCVVTFGDLGELVTTEYWKNVGNNLTAISFMSIGLTLIQVAIKQGLAEQALQRGLNTEQTKEKYEAHKEIIRENNDRMIYLPYFLQIYNKRHTKLRKREFLINNNFCSEQSLLTSGNLKIIKKYEQIIVNINANSIKWSTVEVVYNKRGEIITLDEYRSRRLRGSIIWSLIGMLGMTLLAGGLFFTPSTEPFWQKLVKLFTYVIAIAIGSIFGVVKEYEKGAFGVPNELDEINQIWHEFKAWEIPAWVIKEVTELNNETEVSDEQNEGSINSGTNLQEEQEESKSVQHINAGELLPVPFNNDTVSIIDDRE